MRGLPVEVIRGMVLLRFVEYNSNRSVSIDIRGDGDNKLETAEMCDVSIVVSFKSLSISNPALLIFPQ